MWIVRADLGVPINKKEARFIGDCPNRRHVHSTDCEACGSYFVGGPRSTARVDGNTGLASFTIFTPSFRKQACLGHTQVRGDASPVPSARSRVAANDA